MTRLDLRNLVLWWLDDVNGTYFTTTLLNQSLNNAQIEVQKLLVLAGENYYVTCAQTATVVNQSNYALPVDFLKSHRTEIITSGTPPNENKYPLQPITRNQVDLLPDQLGDPEAYYYQGNKIVLVPTPQSIQTLRICYSKRVADMTDDNNTPDVPAEFQEYIAVLAAIDCAIKDERNTTMLTMKQQMYEKMLKDMAQNRQQDQPRQIVSTQMDNAGYFF